MIYTFKRKQYSLDPVLADKVGDVYLAKGRRSIYIPRYDKYIFIDHGYPSNGANLVEDLVLTAFFCHDNGCNTGEWADGTKMSNWQLSFVYYDILRAFGISYIRAVVRWLGTFIGGGGAAKKNGWWRVKNGA